MAKPKRVRVSASELKGSDTDWARVDALTDEEIEKAIAEDPDAAPIMDEVWFSEAAVSFRLVTDEEDRARRRRSSK